MFLGSRVTSALTSAVVEVKGTGKAKKITGWLDIQRKSVARSLQAPPSRGGTENYCENNGDDEGHHLKAYLCLEKQKVVSTCCKIGLWGLVGCINGKDTSPSPRITKSRFEFLRVPARRASLSESGNDTPHKKKCQYGTVRTVQAVAVLVLYQYATVPVRHKAKCLTKIGAAITAVPNNKKFNNQPPKFFMVQNESLPGHFIAFPG